ncbi:hypothetical protein M0812_06897 [Anaeramoeba flamelloides]|uniref:Ribosomal protein S2 n=1 Tax=Anaeramoeba flamelloides TaxID=1746091 RepID=A0AAV8ABB8_9EUKA|nr:hypothetical protein M0812_06897 [Anaeramoeba flamelloides]
MKFNIEFNKIKLIRLQSSTSTTTTSSSNFIINKNKINNKSIYNTGQIRSSNFQKRIINEAVLSKGVGFLNVANSPFADSFIVLTINEDYQETALEKWKWQRKQIYKTDRFNSGMDALKREPSQKPKHFLILIQSKSGLTNKINLLTEWNKIKLISQDFPFLFILIVDTNSVTEKQQQQEEEEEEEEEDNNNNNNNQKIIPENLKSFVFIFTPNNWEQIFDSKTILSRKWHHDL